MFPVTETAPRARRPYAVIILIVLNTLVFLFMAGLQESQLQAFLNSYALIPARFSNPGAAADARLGPGQWWQLLTNAFMHGGWLHLIFNMWSLWIFGPAMEARCGRIGFLVLYIGGALVASLTHLFANWTSTDPALGASGRLPQLLPPTPLSTLASSLFFSCRCSYFRFLFQFRLGFLPFFGSASRCSRVLTRYLHPEWQAGLLGGRILADSCSGPFS